MKGRRNPFFAREGLPWLIAGLVLAGAGWYAGGLQLAVPGLLLTAWFGLIFRDPPRLVPPSPLGVVSPVDGQVVEVDVTDRAVTSATANRVLIRIDSFGTYTARSPSEGKILNPASDRPPEGSPPEHPGLWVRTDENQDVYLQFSGYRFGIAPRAFGRYGERVGQGERCAYLRLTRFAEVQMPLDSRILVSPGQIVRAGEDLLGRLPHP